MDFHRRRKTGRRSPGGSAYLVREFAEFALLVSLLAIVASFATVPLWLLVGLPLAKLLASSLFYVFLLRRTVHRPSLMGAQGLIGRVTRAETPLCPTGQVKVAGEIWAARCTDRRSVPRFVNVKIVGAVGNTLLVVRADPGRSESDDYWNSDEPR